MTDKGYEQDYMTTYDNAAGLVLSATINVEMIVGNNGYKPTFSDWKGDSESWGFGIEAFGYGHSSNKAYTAYAASLGPSFGFKENVPAPAIIRFVISGVLGGSHTNDHTQLLGTPRKIYIPPPHFHFRP